MRYQICSRDSYYKSGLSAVINSIPTQAIPCEGKIAFIDLLYPGNFSNLNSNDICHIFFIGNNKAVFDLLHNLEFNHDTYFLERNIDSQKLQLKIESLVTSIMQRNCFWSGIRFPLPLNDNTQPLTCRETKILQRLKQHRVLVKKTNSAVLRIKTTHDHKSSEVLRGGNFIQHILERQATVVENFHTFLSDKPHSAFLSGTEICRQVGEIPLMKNNSSSYTT